MYHVSYTECDVKSLYRVYSSQQQQEAGRAGEEEEEEENVSQHHKSQSYSQYLTAD